MDAILSHFATLQRIADALCSICLMWRHIQPAAYVQHVADTVDLAIQVMFDILTPVCISNYKITAPENDTHILFALNNPSAM